MIKLHRIPALAVALGALALAACEDDTTGVRPVPLPAEYAFVTTTDNSTGAAAFVSGDSTLTPYCNLASIHSDAVARYYQGRIYVVNRYQGDNIQVLDPHNGFATMKQFSVGNGSNPVDIAFLSRSRAFVPRYETDELWIVDTNVGVKRGQIYLGDLADADGIPEMNQILVLGERAFVSVQRLDRTTWTPAGKSYLAVFNPYTELFIDADPFTLGVQPIELAGANPYSELVWNRDSGLIWVACEGFLGVMDGGIELIDPDALTTSGIVITEATLGGDVFDVVAIDENRGAAIVSDASFNTMMVGFDLTAPTEIDTIYATNGFYLQDAEVARDGRLFVADRTIANPGLRVFRSDTWAQLTTDPADVCLPPYDIEFGYR